MRFAWYHVPLTLLVLLIFFAPAQAAFLIHQAVISFGVFLHILFHTN